MIVAFIGPVLQLGSSAINPSDETGSDTNDYVQFPGKLPPEPSNC